MDSTNFQPDHHSHHQQQHYLQQQQQHQEPPYPYAAAYSPLLDDDHHLGYGVSPQPHHRHHHPIISNLLSTNQGSYSSCVNREEVPSGSSGVTNSDATSYSYHSLSSNNTTTTNNNDDVMASPNFLSNFLGIINQNPSDGNQLGNHQWMNPPVRSINNNFNSLLSSSGGGGGGGGTSAAANALGQLGLTSSSPSSCLLGLNLQPSDFFNSSSCFGGGRQFPGYGDHHHHHALASPAEKLAYGGLSWPSRSRALDSSTKASTGLVNNGVAGTKRPAGDNCSDTSSKSPSGSGSNKKTSLKNSCPPFKVRKEKLGDRIAALHQLVSPFGKTDTASVLTEAIGYIQFLQDQIHTLCMPNVKPLRNKPCNRLMQPISSEDHQQEIKEGLRKRGLCLVPTSWTSFITADQLDASVNLPAHHYY